MTDPIQHLRELLAKATPGPWKVANWGYDDDPRMIIEGPEEPTPPSHGGRFWFGGRKAVDWGEEWDANNANLIVTAINALPALLAVAEAARKYRDGFAGDWETNEINTNVLDALAKLDEVKHG